MGAMFLDEAARTMHALVAADRLDPPATHDLARGLCPRRRGNAAGAGPVPDRADGRADVGRAAALRPEFGNRAAERGDGARQALPASEARRADRRPARGAAGSFRLRGCVPGRGSLRPDRHVLAAGRYGGSASGGCRRASRTGAQGNRRAGIGRAGAAHSQLDAAGRGADVTGRGPGRSAAARAVRAVAASRAAPGGDPGLDPRQVGNPDAARGSARRGRAGGCNRRDRVRAGNHAGPGDTGDRSDQRNHGAGTGSTR